MNKPGGPEAAGKPDPETGRFRLRGDSMIRHTGKPVLVFSLILFLLCACAPACSEYSFTEDADAIERAADSVFMLEVYSAYNQKTGVGSGFVAIENGLLITNYHVIEDGAYLLAISDDNIQYLVTQLCIANKARDIAILRFDTDPGVPPLELDGESELKRSQPVVAIGSPAGLMNTISLGNISAFYQKNGKDWIQFTAPISSGSSGGALLNNQGKVIGITTATYASAQNINMAVKAEHVLELYSRWDGRTTTALNKTTGTQYPGSIQTAPTATTVPSTVYVTGTGKKYHNNPNCSKMRSPIAMDLLDAISQGYEPCGKCYK